MKKLLTLGLSLLLGLGTLAAQATPKATSQAPPTSPQATRPTPQALQTPPSQDFYAQYQQLDSLPNINRLVYPQVLAPLWIDSLHLQFDLRTADRTADRTTDRAAERAADRTTDRTADRTAVGIQHLVLDLTTLTISPRATDAEQSTPPTSTHAFPRRRPQETVPSPNGQWEAFIKGFNLYLRHTETKEETQLSYDGSENFYYSQPVWSADSQKLVALHTKEAPKHRIPLIESAPPTQKQPLLQWRDYYKPGDAIPTSVPALFHVATRQKIAIDTQKFNNPFQLFFRHWSSDSQWFTFEYNPRGHQFYQVVRVNANTGETKVIVDERFDTFVHYDRNFSYYTKDNKSLIWSSERNGWRHLYLLDAATGAVKKQLTKGNWVVRQVLEVNEEENYILFMGNGRNEAAGEDPYNVHYYRMQMDGSHLIDLTPEQANHRALFSPGFDFLADTYSRPDLPPVTVVRSAKDGRILKELAHAQLDALTNYGWTLPEVFCAKGRDGVTNIWGTIYRPSFYNPNDSYPVVEYIYAGPHDAHVIKDFAAYFRFSKLLEMGFIVVSIDGMGTANRSKAFHDVCWQNLKDAGFPDRILWMQAAAAQYPSMDLERGVGIYGYSAGGQNAMGALLFHNDFYKYGVALCGCHDNTMDKIWWNEQWMGWPIGPQYAASSNVDNAHLLSGQLLLINGELDDNVDPTSTLQVVDALVKANKPFEQLYLPGHTHNLGSNYITSRIFEFFCRHMQQTEK